MRDRRAGGIGGSPATTGAHNRLSHYTGGAPRSLQLELLLLALLGNRVPTTGHGPSRENTVTCSVSDSRIII